MLHAATADIIQSLPILGICFSNLKSPQNNFSNLFAILIIYLFFAQYKILHFATADIIQSLPILGIYLIMKRCKKCKRQCVPRNPQTIFS